MSNSQNSRNHSRFRWFRILLLCAIVIHAGTALLRIDSFLPHPQMQDFAGYYSRAWRMRHDVELPDRAPKLLARLRAEAGLDLKPARTFGPPLWPWLLQPLTMLRYPVAAWLWFVSLLAMIAWASQELRLLARWQGSRLIAFLLVLTFGPDFLALTLGQNSLVILCAALLVGRALRRNTYGASAVAATAWTLAAAAKLYPLAWLFPTILLRRWKLVVLAGSGILIGFSLVYVNANPETRMLQVRQTFIAFHNTSQHPHLDDQSLAGFLNRLGRSAHFRTSGLAVSDRSTVKWVPLCPIRPRTLIAVNYAILLSFGLVLLLLTLRWRTRSAEGLFYLWVLFGLLLFPHMQRYNHVLLLPAMAWLYGQSEGARAAAGTAYFLAALSRLNHTWARLLPSPWAPLASGFGLYAVLVLGGAMLAELGGRSCRKR
jgi:alpha-1,2-mannosyltransferase